MPSMLTTKARPTLLAAVALLAICGASAAPLPALAQTPAPAPTIRVSAFNPP